MTLEFTNSEGMIDKNESFQNTSSFRQGNLMDSRFFIQKDEVFAQPSNARWSCAKLILLFPLRQCNGHNAGLVARIFAAVRSILNGFQELAEQNN